MIKTILKIAIPFTAGLVVGGVATYKYHEKKAWDYYQEQIHSAEQLKDTYKKLMKDKKDIGYVDPDECKVEDETKDSVDDACEKEVFDEEELYNDYYDSIRKPLPHVSLKEVLPESVKKFTDEELDKIRCHTPIYMGNSGCYLDEDGNDIFEVLEDQGLEFHTVYPGFIDEFLGYDIINASYDYKINKLYNQYDEELPVDDVGEDSMAAFLNKYGDCMQPIFVVNKYQGCIYSIRNGAEREYFDDFWDKSLEVPTENAYKRCLMGIKGDTSLYEED